MMFSKASQSIPIKTLLLAEPLIGILAISSIQEMEGCRL